MKDMPGIRDSTSRFGRSKQQRRWAKKAIGVVLATPVILAAGIGAEALVRARLDPEMFQAPTRLYARRLVLHPGLSLDPARLEAYLERLGYRRSDRRSVAIGEYYRSAREWVIGRRSFRVYDKLEQGGVTTVRVGWRGGRGRQGRQGRRGRVSSIRDGSGRRLDYVPLEPEVLGMPYGATRKDRIPVPLAQVPKHVVDAVLSVEDRHFFEHSGLDFKRIAGAAVANVRAMRVVQGGSTLSQQLVKNLFLSPSRSPLRKLRDVAMAKILERRHSKEEILEAYLNEVYLAQDGALAIHGVGRAAQHFFGKDISEVSVMEAALLAGIIRGPSLYSPFRHREAARKRRDLVLSLMRDRELLSERAYSQALAAPLGLRKRPERSRRGRYFVDFVSRQLAAIHGKKTLRNGLTVFTTLDMDMQRVAEQAVSSGLARLEAANPALVREDSPLQAALVALDPRTGEILAMAGGRDYGRSQFNRAVNARRQTGSSFKPIVALAALSRGGGFTLASMLMDRPLAVETRVGMWRPANYDGRFRGEVTLREAIEQSLNVPVARLGMQVGPERIVETARNLGIESWLNAVPSIALGSFEMTPLEMTRAFGVFAANGFRSETRTTLGVLDQRGKVLSRFRVDGEQVYSPAETYLVTSALQGVVERGTGRGVRALGFRGPVAAKSGTTNDFRDAWFIGYTPSLVVGVWVGYDDAKSTGLSGSRAALPIFAQFLKGAVGPDGGPEFSVPSGVEMARAGGDSRLRGRFGCRGESEVFLIGTAPRGSCIPYRYASRTRRSRRGYREATPMFADAPRRTSRRSYRP